MKYNVFKDDNEFRKEYSLSVSFINEAFNKLIGKYSLPITDFQIVKDRELFYLAPGLLETPADLVWFLTLCVKRGKTDNHKQCAEEIVANWEAVAQSFESASAKMEIFRKKYFEKDIPENCEYDIEEPEEDVSDVSKDPDEYIIWTMDWKNDHSDIVCTINGEKIKEYSLYGGEDKKESYCKLYYEDEYIDILNPDFDFSPYKCVKEISEDTYQIRPLELKSGEVTADDGLTIGYDWGKTEEYLKEKFRFHSLKERIIKNGTDLYSSAMYNLGECPLVDADLFKYVHENIQKKDEKENPIVTILSFVDFMDQDFTEAIVKVASGAPRKKNGLLAKRRGVSYSIYKSKKHRFSLVTKNEDDRYISISLRPDVSDETMNPFGEILKKRVALKLDNGLYLKKTDV